MTDLTDLVPRLSANPQFKLVSKALTSGNSATIDGAWGSSCALSVAALMVTTTKPLVVILPHPKLVDDFAVDVAAFCGFSPAIFPAWDSLPENFNIADSLLGKRLQVLRSLESSRPPAVVVTSMAALLQPVPQSQNRSRVSRQLSVGTEVSLDELSAWLVAHQFEKVSAIELPGEFSVHGGIVDIYPPDLADPVRIELFGDDIESIRSFQVESQRTIESLDDITISVLSHAEDHNQPAHNGQTLDPTLFDQSAHFCDSVPPQAAYVLVELPEITGEGKLYLERLKDRRGHFSVEATLERCVALPSVVIAPIAADSFDAVCHLQIESIERFTATRAEAIRELVSVTGKQESVLITCHNEGAKERLGELLKEHAPELEGRVTLCIGSLGHGFRLVQDKIIVLSDNELFGRTEVRRAPRKKSIETRAIDSFLDLQEGDLIVHLSHGIGRYRGMQLLPKDDQLEEHMQLEFHGGTKLYVPVSLIQLVQKYVGGTATAPELSKLGGTAWAKKKQRVAEAVADMAGEMLRLQAERAAKPGISCPPDSHWMEEFESAFPYTETDDQARAIRDIKSDMERSRPMDRLICGDVGYGKTEVAMRAAFKAVDAGRQVAVLVPTTVLAEQHFRSFSSRMAEYPLTIASLSRFKTKGEQRETLQGLAEGTVDLVIGTHRLVQKDVKFKDLGLVVIDEEQRFGVDAKEMLKRLRLEVDVLTLSATPIPRTLHLSLLGIRDISSLETPPQDRVAVETRICRFDPELIRSAIVRELNRGGQVYFVHNRVYNIETMADRIRSIVPEATVEVVHGQMGEEPMERAMLGFVSGKVHVLVATTIIESGLDIPNANTIFINQAENYGLADMHQLRGRVGRFKHRAYCYLLLEEGKSLLPQAAKRLKAIEEFSELGAGFKIAMRDLEIRGAGNILGTEQSGHISVVGYELYCQLLENAVRALKRQPLKELRHVAVDLPLSAYFPPEYIPPGRLKIEMYRKLTSVGSLPELEELSAELRDRFGPIPKPAARLLEIRELQILAQYWQIDEIRLEPGYAVFGYRNPRKIKKLADAQKKPPLRIVDDRSAYLVLPPDITKGRRLIKLIKSVLTYRDPVPNRVEN